MLSRKVLVRTKDKSIVAINCIKSFTTTKDQDKGCHATAKVGNTVTLKQYNKATGGIIPNGHYNDDASVVARADMIDAANTGLVKSTFKSITSWTGRSLPKMYTMPSGPGATVELANPFPHPDGEITHLFLVQARRLQFGEPGYKYYKVSQRPTEYYEETRVGCSDTGLLQGARTPLPTDKMDKKWALNSKLPAIAFEKGLAKRASPKKPRGPRPATKKKADDEGTEKSDSEDPGDDDSAKPPSGKRKAGSAPQGDKTSSKKRKTAAGKTAQLDTPTKPTTPAAATPTGIKRPASRSTGGRAPKKPRARKMKVKSKEEQEGEGEDTGSEV